MPVASAATDRPTLGLVRPLDVEDLHSLRAEVPVAYLRCWRPLKVEVIPQDGMRFERRATQFDGLGRPIQIAETRAQNP